MEIRRASPDDWEACRDIRLRSLECDPAAFCASIEEARSHGEEFWRSRLAAGVTVLAWDGDRAVATGALKEDAHEAGGREIVALWVDPAVRGSGISDALISSLIDHAVAVGSHEVALWVAEVNAPARSLYERCGFALTGEREGMRVDTDQVRMRRALTGSTV